MDKYSNKIKEKEKENKKIPRGISFIATISIIGGTLALLGLGLGFFSWILPGLLGAFTLPLLFSVGYILFTKMHFDSSLYPGIIVSISIAQITLGFGMLKGKYWSWSLTVTLLLSYVILNVVLFFESFWYTLNPANISMNNMTYLLILNMPAILILYYLFRSSTRIYFRRTGIQPDK